MLGPQDTDLPMETGDTASDTGDTAGTADTGIACGTTSPALAIRAGFETGPTLVDGDRLRFRITPGADVALRFVLVGADVPQYAIATIEVIDRRFDERLGGVFDVPVAFASPVPGAPFACEGDVALTVRVDDWLCVVDGNRLYVRALLTDTEGGVIAQHEVNVIAGVEDDFGYCP